MSTPLRDIAAAAVWLDVPKSWLRDAVTAGTVPCTRIGRHVRFSQDHLDAIVAAGEQPAVTVPARRPAGTRRKSPALLAVMPGS